MVCVVIRVSAILLCCGLMFYTSGQNMLGYGKWSVLNVEQCPNAAEMPWQITGRRYKINRTHDAYDADMTLLDDLDDSYTGRATVCKVVDGGCKPIVEKQNGNISELMKKYGGENAKKAFQAIGVRPELPIPKGDYHLEKYVLDMDDLVKQGVYGEYIGQVFIVKDGQDLACAKARVKYEPEQQDDYETLLTPYGR